MIPFKTLLRPAALATTCAFSLICAVPALAGDAPVPLPAQTAAPLPATAPVRPALWKVSDADTTIWLFGTIHILPGDIDWYEGPIAKAFEQSSELVTEIPIDKTQDAQGVILEKSQRKDGKALRDTLDDKQRAAYDAAMGSIGLPPQVFDKNDTWFAALMLTLIPLKTSGYNLESGVDTQVGEKAKARGMQNDALETPEYQISLFDTLPDDTQRRYLGEVIEALPTVKSDIDAMVEDWKAGKPEELAKLLNEQEDDPHLREVLLTHRNENWAKWLKARLDKPGTVFVAVGAGHLAGQGSVQEQLERIGVKSQRVQ